MNWLGERPIHPEKILVEVFHGGTDQGSEAVAGRAVRTDAQQYHRPAGAQILEVTSKVIGHPGWGVRVVYVNPRLGGIGFNLVEG